MDHAAQFFFLQFLAVLNRTFPFALLKFVTGWEFLSWAVAFIVALRATFPTGYIELAFGFLLLTRLFGLFRLLRLF